jgi:hypothetical protein
LAHRYLRAPAAKFLVVAGIAGGVVGAVAGGISLGSRYVDAKLRYEEKDMRLDRQCLRTRIVKRLGKNTPPNGGVL